ncbi:MAG: PD-(D/E)XK motif protein [Candidatus Sulfotelmatobacter sp.]
MDLRSLFSSLEPVGASAAAAIDFTAREIPGFAGHRLAIDSGGAPALLLVCIDNTDLPAIALEHLTVQHGVLCRMRTLNRVEEGKFSIISCRSTDPAMHEYFLFISETIVEALGLAPSRSRIASIVNRLAELFQAMSGPPRKTVQGLWAELLVIARSPAPLDMLRCWHTEPEDRYDFSKNSERLEIKSAVSGFRQHTFSLEQLRPSAHLQVVVASLFSDKNPTGVSVYNLVDEIRSRISNSPKDLLHLERVVALTLGDKWREIDVCFDRKVGEDSLLFFRAEDVPSVSIPLPAGISDVRFRVDLSGCDPVDSIGIQHSLLELAQGKGSS